MDVHSIGLSFRTTAAIAQRRRIRCPTYHESSSLLASYDQQTKQAYDSELDKRIIIHEDRDTPK